VWLFGKFPGSPNICLGNSASAIFTPILGGIVDYPLGIDPLNVAISLHKTPSHTREVRTRTVENTTVDRNNCQWILFFNIPQIFLISFRKSAFWLSSFTSMMCSLPPPPPPQPPRTGQHHHRHEQTNTTATNRRKAS